ncbi:MAG: P1 family peptidase [Acidobacteria bacterium]|nr:P1 family peptidase [Acidobacteriota bacterium]
MLKVNRRKFNHTILGAVGAGLTARLASQAEARAIEDPERRGSLTDVPGIRLGHYTDSRRPTGCTAILFDPVATAAVDYDGSAPGSYLGVLLQPVSPVETIHAILLTGGGLMGLPAVAGVVRFMEERKIGFNWGTPEVPIPITVGAVIADLEVGKDPHIRPDADAAYKACLAASTAPVEEGNVGVGAGGTVGKMLENHGYGGMKGGLGTASVRLGDVVIGALAVLNSVGDIIDWRTGKIIAGARRPDGKGFANIVETIKKLSAGSKQAAVEFHDPALHSTTLIVVATNADFSKTAMTKVAMMASTGAARTINPYHTNGDGDSTFALSTNKVKTDLSISVVGALAADVVSEAVVRAVQAAKSIEGWPAYRDFTTKLS